MRAQTQPCAEMDVRAAETWQTKEFALKLQSQEMNPKHPKPNHG